MNKKILFLVTEDWYFLSHRLSLALASKKEGYEVYVACKDTGKMDEIKKYQFNYLNINLQRGNSSIFVLFKNIFKVRKLIKNTNVSILHAVSMQPIILGLFATFLNRKIKFVAAVTGLGTLFLVNNVKAKIIKFFLSVFLIIGLKKRNISVIVQNNDDKRFINRSLLCPSHKIFLIRGSGVDINLYKFQKEPSHPPIVISYVGRLIKDKGIENLIEAFNIAYIKNKNIKLLLVGSLDKNNMRPISKEYIENINNDNIEYIGEVKDIKKIWGMSHIAILLSRREGLPKSLLEAAASGRAIISTDVPGSREISRKSINAELVKLNDVNATAKAILYLAENHAVRKTYGLKSRELVESDMSEEHVIRNTLSLYKDLYKNNS
tara:strand:- start:38268 stop:39401 length:1134 start_codon:yes stop_codon:yes gene_type:complete